MTQHVRTPSDLERLLDVVCPWYIIVDGLGQIRRTGMALRKLNEDRPLEGTQLLEFFELRRPKALNTLEGLMAQGGRKLHFVTRAAPFTELKGVVAPLPVGSLPGINGGAVISLSFGISVINAVRDYALTGKDFAVTDLTVEMLYLVEAKSAVMQELRNLNTRLENARITAEEQAVTDTLTGLGNRRAMDEVLDHLVSRASPFSVMHIDLDHFKQVNDTFGHAAGDVVLLQVAERLRAFTRIEDTVIRQGGDEFMLVLPWLTDAQTISKLAKRLVAEIEKPIEFGGQDLYVSASIGISIGTHTDRLDPDVMMEEADTALYVVKEQGRHGFRIYVPEMGRMDGSETVA